MNTVTARGSCRGTKKKERRRNRRLLCSFGTEGGQLSPLRLFFVCLVLVSNRNRLVINSQRSQSESTSNTEISNECSLRHSLSVCLSVCMSLSLSVFLSLSVCP